MSIDWSKHDTWDLATPIDFLCCFLFLCNLSQQLSEEAEKLNSLNPKDVVKTAIDASWQAPPRLPKTQAAKRQRNDDQEPVAGPSQLDQGDGLAWREALRDSAAPCSGLGSGVNVDGYDDLDAEENTAWHKSISDWQT